LSHDCGFGWNVARVSPLLRLQTTAEHNLITAFTRGDKTWSRRVIGLRY